MSVSLSPANRNGTSEREGFHEFFECWFSEQNQFLQELNAALEQQKQSTDNNASAAEATDKVDNEAGLCSLIHRVIQHYEHYYRAKLHWARRGVLSMFSPSWTSSLEDALFWIGGWRPTMAFHLLYSKSGLQLEERLAELIRGLSTRDLADLSPRQLTQVDALQRRTIMEEKEITEKMAKHQETAADTSMVELSHVVTELIREREVGGYVSHSGGDEEERVESTLAQKEEGLKELLERADDLRLRTLKTIIDIFTPNQAVHFLISVAELHQRIHDWGKKRDAMQRRANGGSC